MKEWDTKSERYLKIARLGLKTNKSKQDYKIYLLEWAQSKKMVRTEFVLVEYKKLYWRIQIFFPQLGTLGFPTLTKFPVQTIPSYLRNRNRFGMCVAPNERPTPWLSFCVFYEWKYEVLHPVKIEEYFWWERALNYKICYEAIDEIKWVQISALIFITISRNTSGDKVGTGTYCHELLRC